MKWVKPTNEYHVYKFTYKFIWGVSKQHNLVVICGSGLSIMSQTLAGNFGLTFARIPIL